MYTLQFTVRLKVQVSFYKLRQCNINEKALRETQTLRAKNFAPPQTPFPRAQDRRNLISWRWPLPAPTDPVW